MQDLNITEERRREHLERIRKFRLMDDLFMTVCFNQHIPSTQLVLRILLNREDLVVTSVSTQEGVDNFMKRSVRLDILATDSSGKKYDIEIQRADRGAGQKRARYHSSLLDTDSLAQGEAFDQLPDTYVIFITERDVLGRGLPLYRVERYVLDTGEPFDDGSHILYVNGSCQEDTDLGRLMHDFHCSRPEEMYYPELASRVKFFKENTEGVGNMCRLMEEAIDKAVQEAERQTEEKMVCRMLNAGEKPERISMFLEIPVEEVERMRASLPH